MNYNLRRQEDKQWCLPACIQAIIKLRRFMEPSQREIAEFLNVGDRGFDDSVDEIDKFFRRYRLVCRHVNPFMTLSEPPDIILETELNDSTDIMVAYDYLRLHKGPMAKDRPAKHFSIVHSYKPREEHVEILDPSRDKMEMVRVVCLDNLVNSMQAREDERYGFYIVN